MSQGWKCPSCGRAWAPHIDQCKKCEPDAQSEQAPVGPTFAELWDRHYAPWAEVHLPKTWRPVRRNHRKYLVGFFGELSWQQCTHAKADEYVKWRREQTTIRKAPPTNATLNSELASLKACLSWCLTGAPAGQCPITGTNPIEGYPALPVRNVRNFSIAEGDFVRLLEHSRPMLRLILIFALETGMRRDEFRLLQWHEVDEKRQVVKLGAERTKTGEPREVPLSETAQAVLKAVPRYSRSKWVFEGPRENNRPLSKSCLDRWFKRARAKAGIQGPQGQEVWLHSVRKTFGTSKAMAGMPIYMLMDIMGHKSADVHFSYVKMSADYQGQAREFLNGRRGPLSLVPADGQQSNVASLMKFVKADSE